MTQGRAGIHTMNPGGGKAEKYAYKDQRARNGKHKVTFFPLYYTVTLNRVD